MPFAMWLPFGKTREIWTNIGILNDVIMDIVNKKRQQLKQREGGFLVLCCCLCFRTVSSNMRKK